MLPTDFCRNTLAIARANTSDIPAFIRMGKQANKSYDRFKQAATDNARLERARRMVAFYTRELDRWEAILEELEG